jgi:hypothetical protein
MMIGRTPDDTGNATTLGLFDATAQPPPTPTKPTINRPTAPVGATLREIQARRITIRGASVKDQRHGWHHTAFFDIVRASPEHEPHRMPDAAPANPPYSGVRRCGSALAVRRWGRGLRGVLGVVD